MDGPFDALHVKDSDPRIKVVTDGFGAKATYVKCEIHGAWFWLKVADHVSYLKA